jgi:hypothetical protein
MLSKLCHKSRTKSVQCGHPTGWATTSKSLAHLKVWGIINSPKTLAVPYRFVLLILLCAICGFSSNANCTGTTATKMLLRHPYYRIAIAALVTIGLRAKSGPTFWNASGLQVDRGGP